MLREDATGLDDGVISYWDLAHRKKIFTIVIVIKYRQRQMVVRRTNILYFSADEEYVCSSAPPSTSCSSAAMRKCFWVDGWVKLNDDIDMW